MAQDATPRDSAGIKIIDQCRVEGPPRLIEVQPTPDLELGSVEGGDASGFSLIQSAALLKGDRVAVVDYQDRRVRIYDGESGELERMIGRGGEGPGEFGAAPTIAAAESGGIWAWDPGNARLSRFSVDGELLSERRLDSDEMAGIPRSFTPHSWRVSARGDVISLSSRRLPVRGGGLRSVQAVRLIRPGVPPVSVGMELSVSEPLEDGIFVEDPFRSRLDVATHDGELYVSGTRGWQVDVYDLEGTLTKSLRCHVRRVPIDADLIKRQRRMLERGDASDVATLRAYDRMQFADSASAIDGLVATSHGTLWISRWRPWPPTEGRVLDVIDIDGRWLGTVALPPGSGDVLDVRGSRILTVWFDELDVPFVRVYRWRWPASPTPPPPAPWSTAPAPWWR